MKYILLLLIALFSVQSYAASRDEYLLQREIKAVEHQNKVYGMRAVVARENVSIPDSTKTEVRELVKRSIAVDKPTPTKVGTPMLKRLYSPQAVVGTAAVAALLGAIGWVMEDGTYVKYKEPDPEKCQEVPASCGTYVWKRDDDLGTYSNQTGICKALAGKYNQTFIAIKDRSSTEYGCAMKKSNGNSDWWLVEKKLNPNPSTELPKVQKVPLTAPLLGAAMLGKDYKDPDPNFDNDRINTGGYTGVAETYEHDPSGVGNERADDMDEKLKNAKPTDDGKPSYIGDPKYDSKPLTDDRDDSTDRGWDEKGDEATGGTEQEKDPETGEPTGNQSIIIQFPLFCSWASSMCQWYDAWKASDKVHQKFEEDVKDHQKDEKSFWQTVKDWFDWTKEEPEPEEPEPPQVDDQGIFKKTFDTTFSLSKECPPDIPIVYESTLLTGSFTFSMNWLCIIFSFMAYPLVFLSHCIGIWILYEAVIQKEIKW